MKDEKLFSPTELKIIKVLGRKRMKIGEITEEIYNGKVVKIESANAIAGAIRRINRKCFFHRLDWYLAGEGSGRNGRTIWKEKV